MRVTLKELLEKLNVPSELGPYETWPWSHYDGGKGVTISAEVRMSGDGAEIEAEGQFMHDTPPAGGKPIESICHIRATPGGSDNLWEVRSFRLRGEAFGADIHNWEEKCCVFFSLLVGCLVREEMPDIDALVEEAFPKDYYYDQYGGGGGKGLKMKAGMDMKKTGGF